jgi:flagellar basal-body rod protein FlgG
MLAVLHTRIQVTLDNIANVNTPGFKRSVVQLGTLPPETLEAPGLQLNRGGTAAPVGAQVGTGVQLLSTYRIHSQGTLEITERTLDVAIDGAGFFQILLADGSIGYTRDGHFLINSEGVIVNTAGNILQPQTSLPSDVLEINIDASGRVTGRTAGSPDTTTMFGDIRLTNFLNPAGLLAVGTNVVRQTAASGPPTVDGTPGENGLGFLTQGFIERSNVQMFNELIDLYQARREYQAGLHALLATGTVGFSPPSPGK